MSAPATLTGPAAQSGVANTKPEDAPTAMVDFTRASMEYCQQFLDTSLLMTTSAQVVTGGNIEIPAYGYLRSVLLFITATGGVGATAVAKEDAPYSIIDSIRLSDVNGASVVILTGYSIFIAHKYGGYQFASNPALAPSWSAMTTVGNLALALRIPVEIGRRDALGSLPNSNSSSTYKLEIRMAASTAVYSTSPSTTLPTVRWQGFIEAWAQPSPVGLSGEMQATQPPSVGTTQFWSEQQYPVVSGQNRIRLQKVGNLVRAMFFVFRATSDGLRATGETNLPTDFSMVWDDHTMFNYSKAVNKHYVYERYGLTPESGLLVVEYMHDWTGHPGDGEMRDLWLPTNQATKLELLGTFGAAGTLTVVTCDVAPAGPVFL